MSPRSRWLLIAWFIVVAAVCVRLGIWQVHRLTERRSANAAALDARLKPEVILDGEDPATIAANRRVRAMGRYDHTHDIVLRGAAYQGVPGVEVVTPLLVPGRDTAILVNRGFVPAPDAVTVELDSLHEPGEVRVEGLALPLTSGGGAPLQQGQQTSWARLDLNALRGRLPYAVYPIYIRQLPDSSLPRFPRRLDPPLLDDGPHLSYAIQWFSFSILALVFGVVIGRQKRERDKDERER
jgi:surfeit locus 1 family protein